MLSYYNPNRSVGYTLQVMHVHCSIRYELLATNRLMQLQYVAIVTVKYTLYINM